MQQNIKGHLSILHGSLFFDGDNTQSLASGRSLYSENFTASREKAQTERNRSFKNTQVLPVRYSPGVDVADSLVSRGAQVGLVIFPVPLDIFQRVAWHRDNGRPAPLRRARECEAASELLFILGSFL